MIERWLNTASKRFVVAMSLYYLCMVYFFGGMYRLSIILISMNDARDLMKLTSLATRSLYWPVEAIANVLDLRLSFVSTLFTIVKSIPFGFWMVFVLVIYLLTFPSEQRPLWLKHQKRFMVYWMVSVLGVLVQLTFFVFGFFGGSIGSVIARIHGSGYAGILVSVGLSVLALIMIALLWVDFYDNLRD